MDPLQPPPRAASSPNAVQASARVSPPPGPWNPILFCDLRTRSSDSAHSVFLPSAAFSPRPLLSASRCAGITHRASGRGLLLLSPTPTLQMPSPFPALFCLMALSTLCHPALLSVCHRSVHTGLWQEPHRGGHSHSVSTCLCPWSYGSARQSEMAE